MVKEADCGDWMRRKYPLVNQTYVVAWDEIRMIKAGYTSLRRWRNFVLRGARLVHLYRMPTARAALDLELRFEVTFARNGLRAFGSASEAAPFLGSSGGGYLECFFLPEHCYEHVLDALPEHVPDSAIELDPGWRAKHDQPSLTTDVTDGLTKRVVTSEEISYVRNARGRKGIIPNRSTASAPARCAHGAVDAR